MDGCTWKGVQNSCRSRDFGLSGQTYTKINSKTLTNEIHLSIPYQSFQFLNQKQTPNTPSEFLSTYFTDISFQAPPFRHIGFEISIYPFDTDLPGHLFREIVHHGQSMHLSILDYFIWNIILFFIIQNYISIPKFPLLVSKYRLCLEISKLVACTWSNYEKKELEQMLFEKGHKFE